MTHLRSALPQGEIPEGSRLQDSLLFESCQTRVRENLEVLIPPESCLEEEQILSESLENKQKTWKESPPIHYSEPDWVSLCKRPSDPASLFEPLTSKLYLELPRPTIDDNIPDTGRIMRELRKRLKYPSYEITLPCLKDLFLKVRRSDWKITATLSRHNGMGQILQIEEGNTAERNYGAAVDVGTTTVVVQLVDLKTGKVIGVEGNHNLQAHYGEDVLSRIAYVCGKGSLDLLQKAVVENINILSRDISQEKGNRE